MSKNVMRSYVLECHETLWLTWHTQKWHIVWESKLHMHVWPHGDSWFVAEWTGWCCISISRFRPLRYAALAKSGYLWKILWSIITLQKLSGWLFLSINISLQKCSAFVCYPHGGINTAFHFIYLDIFKPGGRARPQQAVPSFFHLLQVTLELLLGGWLKISKKFWQDCIDWNWIWNLYQA